MKTFQIPSLLRGIGLATALAVTAMSLPITSEARDLRNRGTEKKTEARAKVAAKKRPAAKPAPRAMAKRSSAPSSSRATAQRRPAPSAPRATPRSSQASGPRYVSRQNSPSSRPNNNNVRSKTGDQQRRDQAIAARSRAAEQQNRDRATASRQREVAAQRNRDAALSAERRRSDNATRALADERRRNVMANRVRVAERSRDAAEHRARDRRLARSLERERRINSALHSHSDRRVIYRSYPRNHYRLILANGYAGRGYYYGPPNYPYYYEEPGIRFFGARNLIPAALMGMMYSPMNSVDADVQRALADRGYYDGPIDGIVGSGTREAIADFQIDNGLEPTGYIDSDLLASLGL